MDFPKLVTGLLSWELKIAQAAQHEARLEIRVRTLYALAQDNQSKRASTAAARTRELARVAVAKAAELATYCGLSLLGNFGI